MVPPQGLVLDCSALEFEAMPELPAPAPVDAATGRLPVWLCLDEVMDPVSMSRDPVATAHQLQL